MNDAHYMQMALDLAEQGRGYTSPKPMVGALVVKNGIVLGRGYHQAAGGAHAEVHAIDAAGAAARGGTLYVNLEPCNHIGRTPPRTQKRLAAGIERVVIGMRDAAGRGPAHPVAARGGAQPARRGAGGHAPAHRPGLRRRPRDERRRARDRARSRCRRLARRQRGGVAQRVRQPRVERGALHAGRRGREGGLAARRRCARVQRAGHGRGHRAPAHPAAHRALLSRGPQPLAGHRRHRTGARHRQARAAAPPGAARNRERTRPRERLQCGVSPAAARRAGRRSGLNGPVPDAELASLEKQFRQLEARQTSARDLERSLSSKAEEALAATAGGESSLQIVERASVPSLPEPSARRLLFAASLLFGRLAALYLALLSELVDDRTRCREDLEDLVDEGGACAEIGRVAVADSAGVNLASPAFRSFRRFVNDLCASSPEWTSLAIVSPGPGDGRSPVARGTALCMAMRGESGRSCASIAGFTPSMIRPNGFMRPRCA